MNVSELALVQGMDDTRAALRRWQRAPAGVVFPWALGALAIAITLLAAVWIVAHLVTPDPSGYLVAGVNEPADLGALGHVLFRNSLVLALHSMACVAGFIAGSSLPLQAANHRGWRRTVHEKAAPAAIVFVAAATTFSLCTQGYVLGSGACTLAARLDVSRSTARPSGSCARPGGRCRGTARSASASRSSRSAGSRSSAPR